MTLSDLPEELVSNVAARLGSDDAFALRLSCKALETKTFHEFATEYFTEKAVHFTTDSLQVLLEISRNTRLRKYLKEVYVVPAAFSVEAFSSHRGACCSWTPSVVRVPGLYRLRKTMTDMDLFSSYRNRPRRIAPMSWIRGN